MSSKGLRGLDRDRVDRSMSMLMSSRARGCTQNSALRRLMMVLVLPLVLVACGGGGGGSGPSPGVTPVSLRSLALSPASAAVRSGATVQLIATGTYSDGTTQDLSATVRWSSSSTLVGTVSDSGQVTALAAGTTTISATASAMTASTTITVHDPQASLVFTATIAGQPAAPLLEANDGNFYGTTMSGGSNACGGIQNSCGTLFRMTRDGHVTVLWSFGASASDGNFPSSALIQATDGALYGTTAYGGAYGAGTVFRYSLSSGYSILYSFGVSATDGTVPVAAILQAADGNFYGTTSQGGTHFCPQVPGNNNNCGTVFKLTPAGAETVIYSFGSFAADGVEPTASLVQTADGSLYGTTTNGGANACTTSNETNNCGTVFKISPAGDETVLHSFGESLTDAIAPQGPLVAGFDGALYGTTPSGGGGLCGGFFGCGTVYKIALDGTESVVYAFAARENGDGPAPFLVQAPDGQLYGTTTSGGSNVGDLNGTAFALSPSGVHTILYSFGPLNTNPSDPNLGLTLGSDGAFYGITSESSGGMPNVFRMSVN